MRIVLPPVINEYYNVGLDGSGAAINYVQQKVQTAPVVASNASLPATVASCTITTHGGPVQVTVYGDGYNPSSPIYCQLNLYRGSTPIGHRTIIEGNGNNENQEFSLSVIDEPEAPGTYTYSLKVVSIGGANVTFGEADGPVIYAVELQNIIGPRGYQGEDGVRGLTGAQGSQGSQGTQGQQGTQGRQGTQGTQGSNGNQGSQGTQGTQGTQGSNGNQGSQGTQGSNGNQGSQGTQGTQGSNGNQGSQGTQGFNGNQGSQGTQGSSGTQGTQGPLNGAAIVCVAKPSGKFSPGEVGQIALFDGIFYMYVTNVSTGVSGWVRWDIKTGGGFDKF
jgi:hypothetical protein